MYTSTILIINDVPDQLDLMGAILRSTGYQVLEAGEGEEGLDAALSERPNMIISDVSMPQLDRIELCRLTRASELPRETPLLLVSAVRRDSARIVVQELFESREGSAQLRAMPQH